MLKNKKTFLVTVIVLGLLLVPTIALAGGPIELFVPESYFSCDPADSITVTNIPAGFEVAFTFYHEDVEIGSAVFTSPGGNVSADFPYGDLTGNFGVVVSVTDPSTGASKSFSGKWSVICEEPPSGGEGCTPGYWKQKQHFDSWVGYSQDDVFLSVFGAGFDKTLLAVLKSGGGGEVALGRHSVAALLNASNPDVAYAYSEAQIIQMVYDAFTTGDFEGTKNLFEYENELGCPLN